MLNCIYAWCVAPMDAERREKWEYQMSLPLPGYEEDGSDMSDELEGDSFMNMMALNPQS